MSANDVNLYREALDLGQTMWRGFQGGTQPPATEIQTFHDKMRSIQEPQWNVEVWKGLLFYIQGESIVKTAVAKGTIEFNESADRLATTSTGMNTHDVLSHVIRARDFLREFSGMGRWLVWHLDRAIRAAQQSGITMDYFEISDMGWSAIENLWQNRGYLDISVQGGRIVATRVTNAYRGRALFYDLLNGKDPASYQ